MTFGGIGCDGGERQHSNETSLLRLTEVKATGQFSGSKPEVAEDRRRHDESEATSYQTPRLAFRHS